MLRISSDELAVVLGPAKPKLLGEGMEGAVYELDGSHVAKFWFAGSADALSRTADFYAALNAKSLPFAVPQILEVRLVADRVVTIERRLTGTKPSAPPADLVLDVLAALAGSGAMPIARQLTVLGEDTPLYAADEDFPVALAALALRRAERFGPILRRAVDRFDEKSAALAARLREVGSGRRTVVHGDLFPGNLLVGRPNAVLDWGFLTTEGDPAFDAAVAAAIFDMYGPDALSTERALLARIEARLGYDHTTLLTYRAAYSLITANAYDQSGRDGHFAWCTAALNRPDITRALLG